MEHAVEDRPDGLRVGRRRVRVLHLPENLRLADDQRVEAGGDAEQDGARPRDRRARRRVGDVGRRTVVELADESLEIARVACASSHAE
jgi:hypothetical protein